MEREELKDVRVLLVDDDEDDYLLIKKTFGQIPGSPFILEWVATVPEAKKRIDEKRHDIYLIDYQLGEYTGLDILEFAKPQKRSQPFILLTGVGNEALEWQSMRLAASDYLVKGTFDAQLLSRTLYYALQRKKIEEQRVSQLVELNRSKDEFISIASHQLRTPATGVKQYIGILLEGMMGELRDEHRKILEKAYESNERQLRIVSDLLKVARVDAGRVLLKKANVPINQLIEDVIREQRHTINRRKQTLLFHAASPDLTVYVDSDSMRMVIENLLDNASKYSEEEKEITIRIVNDAARVRIDISDQGVGIASDDLSRLYEKFSRIDNPLSTKVGGTGLGLYWAKKIVDLHDGSIIYSANKGGGSTFSVSLPKEGT